MHLNHIQYLEGLRFVSKQRLLRKDDMFSEVRETKACTTLGICAPHSRHMSDLSSYCCNLIKFIYFNFCSYSVHLQNSYTVIGVYPLSKG